MDDKITIIEGPPPVFESIDDGWAAGLNEGPVLYDLAMTRLRTYNGPALVERCHRAWRDNSVVYLHYKNRIGLEETASILAARSITSQDGQVLLLWVRRRPEDVEEEDDSPDISGD
ncbi:MAG: hypothetical protein HGA53_07065 [Anaerolineaceae bacterium]|nr:hypothetical protein [Anaerolineaceae bacterium]